MGIVTMRVVRVLSLCYRYCFEKFLLNTNNRCTNDTSVIYNVHRVAFVTIICRSLMGHQMARQYDKGLYISRN